MRRRRDKSIFNGEHATVLRNFRIAVHIFQRCNVLYYVDVDDTRTPAVWLSGGIQKRHASVLFWGNHARYRG
jgi:hypothetical protein